MKAFEWKLMVALRIQTAVHEVEPYKVKTLNDSADYKLYNHSTNKELQLRECYSENLLLEGILNEELNSPFEESKKFSKSLVALSKRFCIVAVKIVHRASNWREKSLERIHFWSIWGPKTELIQQKRQNFD